MVQASLDESDGEAAVQMKRDPKTGEMKMVKKLSIFQTVRKMYRNDGLAAFFRGLGPALILTINPIIAYTSFEQIKNAIIARRGAARLPTGSQSATSKPVILPLTDLDNFLLGAFCKLLATGSLYPYLVVKVGHYSSSTVEDTC
jgi:adenine nucleotide transporter 17